MKDNAGCNLIVFCLANKVPEKLVTIRVINRSAKTSKLQHLIKMLNLAWHEGPGIHVAHDGRFTSPNTKATTIKPDTGCAAGT